MSEEVKVTFDDIADILKRRNLETCGKVQKMIDNDVLKFSEPYIPFDTGMLRNSGISATVIGSGEVKWNTPYAKRQYYTNKGGEGLRGKMWFERMKADRIDDILRNAANVAGGMPKR